MTAGAGVVAHEEATGHGGVRVVGGFRELEKDYDAFILDQFGVWINPLLTITLLSHQFSIALPPRRHHSNSAMSLTQSPNPKP